MRLETCYELVIEDLVREGTNETVLDVLEARYTELRINPEPRLQEGDRVKFSPLGIQRQYWPITALNRNPDSISGVVSKVTRTGTVYVTWEHYGTPQTYSGEVADIVLERVALQREAKITSG